MTYRLKVKEGQRYAQRLNVASRASVWKVGSILSNVVAVPHARLVNVEDPFQTKTISCTTLANKLYYELVADHHTGLG